MKLCRYQQADRIRSAFYLDTRLLPLQDAARAYEQDRNERILLPEEGHLLPALPHGSHFEPIQRLYAWISTQPQAVQQHAVPLDKVQLLTPMPRPPKLLLLAGNYAEHIQEGGGLAVAREQTFPYVFSKPPTTALNHPDAPIRLPKTSPHHIDWEAELGVIIGQTAHAVPEQEALNRVAGYTVVNDISDREFHPNPNRRFREKDSFFDWLHGKWHDGFCPAGPCVVSARAIADPQNLTLTLKVNGELKQNSNTRLMIFPVAAIIAFISQFVTLEPGDIISTGTPAGVGHSQGSYLKAGDKLEAAIESIGILRNHVVAD